MALNHLCKIAGIVLVLLSITVLAHATAFSLNCSSGFNCSVKVYCQSIPGANPGLLVGGGSCYNYGPGNQGQSQPCSYNFSSSTIGEHSCSATITVTAMHSQSQPNETTSVYINGVLIGTTVDNYCNGPPSEGCTFCGTDTQVLPSTNVVLAQNNTVTFEGHDSHAVVSFTTNCQPVRDCSSNSAPSIVPIQNKTIGYNGSFSIDLWNTILDADDSFGDLNYSFSVSGNSVFCSVQSNRYLNCEANNIGTSTITLFAEDDCDKNTSYSFSASVVNLPPTLNVPDYEAHCDSNLFHVYDLRSFSTDEEVNLLNYTLLSQSNPSKIFCSIDQNRFVSCVINSCGEFSSLLSIRTTDKNGLYADDNFSISVVNTPPYWNTIPQVCLNEEKSKFLDLRNYSNDLEDKNKLSYSLLSQSNSSAINCFIQDSNFISCNNLGNLNAQNILSLKALDSNGKYSLTTATIKTNCFDSNHHKIIFESEQKSVCLEHCTTHNAVLRVKNQNDAKKCFDFEAESFPDELSVSLTNKSFCLNEDEETTFVLSVNTCGASNDDYLVKVFDEDNNLQLYFNYRIGNCQNFDGFRIEEFDGTICAGAEKQFPVFVKNTSSSTKTVALMADNSFLLPFFSRDNITLNAGEEKKLYVTINAKALSTGKERVILRGDAPNYSISKSLAVEIVDCSNIKERTFIINPPSVCFDVTRGEYFEGSFTVKCLKKNCCDCSFDDRKIDLRLFGIQGELSNNPLDLHCGTEKAVFFNVLVPENFSAGINYFTVTGKDISSPFVEGYYEEKQICLNVLPERSSRIELRAGPADIPWCGSSIFELEIINSGDLDENFSLSALGLPAGVSVSLSEPFVSVPSGTSKIVYVSVSASALSSPLNGQFFKIIASGSLSLEKIISFNVKESPSFSKLEIVSAIKSITLKANSSGVYSLVIRNNSGATLNNILVSIENSPSGVVFEPTTINQLLTGETIVVSGKLSVSDMNGTFSPVIVASSSGFVDKKPFVLVVEKKGSFSSGNNSSIGTGFFGLFTLTGENSFGGVIPAVLLALFLIILIAAIILVVGVVFKQRRKEVWETE